MPLPTSRRRFLKSLGLKAAALPFLMNLPSLGFAGSSSRKKRLVVMFSPNGTVPKEFWPDQEGSEFVLKPILKPLEPFRDRMLVLNGVCDKVRGDGDSHMRGIACLLTGIELFPGNIQGGSHTPAGWSTGISLDQELKNVFQANPETHTRFGSLEFGVMVPDRADTWTRLSYAGPNKPVAPIDNPYQMFEKLYGQMQDRESLSSVLDDVQADLKKLSSVVSVADRRLLDEHATFVREMEKELKAAPATDAEHAVPDFQPGIREDNDNIPQISRMQIDLMVNSFVSDFARVSTLQFTNSVGQARMRWLGIDEGHHSLSHEGDDNADAQEKLTKINTWYCEQLAYLVKRLAETPEPGGPGSLLDNTQIVWGNELGKGNSHTLDNIPFVMVGGGSDFKTGRSLKFNKVPHHRLLLSLAHSFGHQIETFGNPSYCKDGPLAGLS
ncbi:MAG: DUF1552 domain-containing protein [Planctomycetota bacterium]|nr:DUF1552 domain-containing protein [Planctomycetota bacterium]MDA1162311.1 DUF1552 domain-containing protein [Planctomycetota bacterium]